MKNKKYNAYLAKKKLIKSYDRIEQMVKKGIPNKDNNLSFGGTDEAFEKLYANLSNVKSIPLEKVSLNSFAKKDSGIIRAGGFFIFKNNSDFLLFKGRVNQVFNPESKKKLGRAVTGFNKKLNEGNFKDRDTIIKEMPFLEWKTLNKTDIINLLHTKLTKDEVWSEKTKEYFKIPKITKKALSELSLHDIQYFYAHAYSNDESMEIPKLQGFSEMFDTYKVGHSYFEYRLAKGWSEEIELQAIPQEEIKSIIEEHLIVIKDLKQRVEKSILAIVEAKKDPKDPINQSVMINETFELSKIRDIAKKQIAQVEKLSNISMEEEIELVTDIENDTLSELNYVEKVDIEASESPLIFKKIGLKRENEIVNEILSNDKMLAISEELNIELIEKTTITNYGVFDDPQNNEAKALNNLLLYAKQMNEVRDNAQNQNKDIAQLQEESFAI